MESTTSQSAKPVKYTELPVFPYSWSKKKGFNDVKEITVFANLLSLYAMIEGKSDTKLNKIINSKDYISKVKIVLKELAANLSGPVLFVKTNKDSEEAYISGYELNKFTLKTNASDLSKKEFKSNFGMCARIDNMEADALESYRTVDSKLSELIKKFNSIPYLVGEETKYFEIGYTPLFKEGSDNIYINLTMAKKSINGKFECTGYPSAIINNNLKWMTITKDCAKKNIPMPFNKELTHVDKLHELFGAGTVVLCQTRFDWSLSKNTVSLKIKISGNDFSIESCAPDNSFSKQAEAKWGMPANCQLVDETEMAPIVGDVNESEVDEKNIKDREEDIKNALGL